MRIYFLIILICFSLISLHANSVILADSSPSVSVAPISKSVHTPGSLTKVKLGEAQRTPLFLAHYIALVNGYFREQGLEVELIDFGAGSKARTALIAKEVDFAANAGVHLPLARLANAPVKAVAVYNSLEGFSLMVRSDLRETVKQVADLKGKIIGITAPGSGSWALVVTYLKKAGLDPDRDVKLVALNTGSAMYAALKLKQVDALGSFEPIDSQALFEQKGFLLIDIYDPKQHSQWLGTHAAASMFLLTHEDVIANKSEQVPKMVNALHKGLRFAALYSPEEIAADIAPLFSGMDVKLLAAGISHMKPSFPPTAALSEKAYIAEMNIYYQAGVIKSLVPFAQGVDAGFAGQIP